MTTQEEMYDKALELVGKKCLSLMTEGLFYPSIGDKVFIVEAKKTETLNANTKSIEMEWRILSPAAIDLLYEHGFYKLVGIGLVIAQQSFRYVVLVQDTCHEFYQDTIPF